MFSHTPPCANAQSSGNIHDRVTNREELSSSQRLSEEVGEIIGCPYEGHSDFMRLYCFTDKKVSPLDVLDTRMVLRIVRQILSCAVICSQRYSLIIRLHTELGDKA